MCKNRDFSRCKLKISEIGMQKWRYRDTDTVCKLGMQSKNMQKQRYSTLVCKAWVVRASGCQCQSCNSPGFDPSILRHSGIWGAAYEELLNNVHKKKKVQKIPHESLRHCKQICKLQISKHRNSVQIYAKLNSCHTEIIIEDTVHRSANLKISRHRHSMAIERYLTQGWFYKDMHAVFAELKTGILYKKY